MATDNDAIAKRYRFLLAERDRRAQKIDDLRWELRRLEEELPRLSAWIEDLKGTVCSNCNGGGMINVWHDQDDCKTETCKVCKGSGLALSGERK